MDKLFSILIVDDDADLCGILAAVLGRICLVHVVHDLHGADAYLTGERPAIILLDNNLPDGGGIGHIGHLLTLYPATKILLMTADNSVGLKACAISAGAIKFITKPFKMAEISNFVLAVFAGLRAA